MDTTQYSEYQESARVYRTFLYLHTLYVCIHVYCVRTLLAAAALAFVRYT